MTGKGNFPALGSGCVAPRLLADEMLGRLARYLRMVGCDTVFARGWSDDAIVRTARAEGRTVLTRDRELATRLDDVLRLRSDDLAGQFRELVAAFPTLPRRVSFERCTLCNGVLEPSGGLRGVDRERSGDAVYACSSCGHRFWEGSHTAAVRRHVAAWTAGVAP
jgi:uncharacterized protein